MLHRPTFRLASTVELLADSNSRAESQLRVVRSKLLDQMLQILSVLVRTLEGNRELNQNGPEHVFFSN